MAGLSLQLLPGEFAVCRLPATDPWPVWAGSRVFSSITRTADELSVICPAEQFPADVRREGGWRLVKFAGPFDFDAVGVLASVTQPLAHAGISLLAVATFETDYVLLKENQLAEAILALEAAGHTVRRS